MKDLFRDSEVFYSQMIDKDSFGQKINISSELIVHENDAVVLFGLDDINADPVRKELYKTAYCFENINVYDLGNLRNNDEESITLALNQLTGKNLNVIILGTINNKNLEQIFDAYKEKFINIAFVEKKGDNFFGLQNLIEGSHFINKARLLFYQSHLLHTNKFENLRTNQTMRLGEFRNNYRQSEPLIRDIDIMLFNLDSIRYSEIPGIVNTSPSGLTSEEACQIMRYLGMNTRNNLICFPGYDPKFDFHSQGAMLISQMIWYYLEGLDQRIVEDITISTYIQTFMVDLNDYNLTLKFLQSKKTGRWWVEIPLEEDHESYLMPCSEEDFDKARNNDLSYRIFNELSH